MIHKNVLTICLCLIISFAIGCESDENNSIAQAEACLNDNANNQAAVAGCSSYITNLNTPRARSLKCSIHLFSSGLSNSRIIKAVEVMDDDAVANKEIQFMALVSLDNVTAANAAKSICTGTDTPGIEFIANASSMGTTFANNIDGLDLTTIDENTTFSPAQVTEIVADCEADTGPTGCMAAIGSSVENMYSIFCSTADPTDNDVCVDVNAAIAGGGTPEAIGQALIDLME